MKRMLIFATAYYPHIGGAEVSVKEVTDRIPEIEFDMITARLDRNSSNIETIGNVRVHRVGGRYYSKLLFPLLGLIKARQLHRHRAYDAIWAIMASYGGLCALFFKLLSPRVPYILSLQEGDPLAHIRRKAFIIQPLFRRIFLRADRIHAISSFLKQWAQDMGYRKDVVVVPNGYEREAYEGTLSLDTLRERIKHIEKEKSDFFAPDAEIVITTSRLVEKNGVDIVVRAMASLPSNIRFLIVGGGSQEASLRRLVKEEGVTDRVHMTGHVDHSMIPLYLAIPQVFAFVRPSRSEGMGNSFIEAMAAGEPVIATIVGGRGDFIENEKTGLIVEQDNPSHVARAIERYRDDDDLRERIARNALQMVAETYEWDTIAARMDREVFNPVFTV